MDHLSLFLKTKEINDILDNSFDDLCGNYDDILDNSLDDLCGNYIELEKNDFLQSSKETIEKYSNQLFNKEIAVTDRRFKEVSMRLLEDILSIYLSEEKLYDIFFNVVENLNTFYKDTYLETKSPVARLYQGEFSVIYKLFLKRRAKALYEKVLNSNKQIEKIIWHTMIQGSYNLKGEIDEQTAKDLNWLECNNFINILPIGGYVIRISNNYKFMISLNREKYIKSYYSFYLSSKLENDLITDENSSYINKKYLIFSDSWEDNYEPK